MLIFHSYVKLPEGKSLGSSIFLEFISASIGQNEWFWGTPQMPLCRDVFKIGLRSDETYIVVQIYIITNQI